MENIIIIYYNFWDVFICIWLDVANVSLDLSASIETIKFFLNFDITIIKLMTLLTCIPQHSHPHSSEIRISQY